MPRKKGPKKKIDYSEIDRKYFECENCGHEQHKRYKNHFFICDLKICDQCYEYDEHDYKCRKFHSVRFICDRWRYLWYHKLDENGVSKFCKFSVENQ